MKLFRAPTQLWVAEQRGRGVFMLAGKPGKPGVPRAKELPSEAAALAFLEKERDARLAEGYVLVDPDAGIDGPFTVDGAPRVRPPLPRIVASLEAQMRTHVLGGFADPEALHAILTDLLELEMKQRSSSVRTHLEDFVRDVGREERRRTPPEPWINPRITAAFAELNRERGVVALENAGYTQSDGWDDIREEAAAREARGQPRPIGGCFYHFQDLERAVRGEGLALGFGALIVGADQATHAKAALEVANLVVEVLGAHQVPVHWDGTAEQRIAIPPFVWFRRP